MSENRELKWRSAVLDAASATAFDNCLARLQETHYRKRNLMAALDARIGAA